MPDRSISDILAAARASGKVAVPTPDGEAHLHPDGPGRWRVTVMGKKGRQLLHLTDTRLIALLHRWGYR